MHACSTQRPCSAWRSRTLQPAGLGTPSPTRVTQSATSPLGWSRRGAWVERPSTERLPDVADGVRHHVDVGVWMLVSGAWAMPLQASSAPAIQPLQGTTRRDGPGASARRRISASGQCRDHSSSRRRPVPRFMSEERPTTARAVRRIPYAAEPTPPSAARRPLNPQTSPGSCRHAEPARSWEVIHTMTPSTSRSSTSERAHRTSWPIPAASRFQPATWRPRATHECRFNFGPGELTVEVLTASRHFVLEVTGSVHFQTDSDDPHVQWSSTR